MPTQSFQAALLLLSNDKDGLPWTSPQWQTITGVLGVPWATAVDADDDADALNVPSWNVLLAKSVKSFAQTVWSMPQKNRDAYIHSSAIDNDTVGRTTWSDWIKTALKKWKLNAIIDQVLASHNLSPNALISALAVQELPSAEDAQIYNTQNDLALELFGEEAFLDSSNYLKPHIGHFCRTLLTHTWNRYRKVNHRELDRMQKILSSVSEKWKFFSQKSTEKSAKQIKAFLLELRRLLQLLTRYNDEESKNLVKGFVTELQAMLATLMKDESIGNPNKIPKVIQEALLALASREDVEMVAVQLRLSLENIRMAENSVPLDLELDDHLDLQDWSEGVEELAKTTEDELWAKLGLPERKIPFFQDWTDSTATIDPWSAEGQAWLKDEGSDRVPLKPRWHQLVGIYRMLERAFEAKPVLLMDAVGLGKTLQVLGTIACLAFYRNYYASHKKFPGQFADRTFPSADGNIPDLPHIIVCPVNLREQWNAEIKRFLAFATFDVLPYTGRFNTRKIPWDILRQRCEQPMINRLILATFTAIQDDASICYNKGGKMDMGRYTKSSRYAKNAPHTLFDGQYNMLAVDEAHTARKHNVAHMAVRALKEKANILIAMTATPVTTRPEDLYVMGQWMGLSGFDDYDEFKGITSKMSKANRADLTTLRDAGAEGSILRGMLTGARNKDAPSLQKPRIVYETMQKMRERFATHVIRRTIDSVDYMGEKLFGMKPYLEHILKVRMYNWEMERLRETAKVMLQDNPVASADTSKNFYIEFRRSILHPTSNPKMGMDFPTVDSLEAWESHPQKTVKLDVLGKIVKYHLAKDGQQPLTMDEDGQTVIPDPTRAADEKQYDECDRIVIYSAFPSSNNMILDILRLHGISAAELNGSLTVKQRQAALNSFRHSTRNHGDRVLVLSAVGMVGLNLACANVMIMVDTTWSAMDDEQLKGRIFRYPQQKQVHFYRLIALKTPDVFLNNISFGKGELQTAFVNSHLEFQRLFRSDLVDDDNASLISVPSQSDGGDDDTTAVGDSKGKAKGRGGRGRGKRTNAKGKRPANVAAEESSEGIRATDGSGGDDDALPESNTRLKASSKQKVPDRSAKSAPKRPPNSPPKIGSKSKRSRKGTVTQPDESDLAEATKAMNVDSASSPNTSKASPASFSTGGGTRGGASTRPLPRQRPPPIQIPIENSTTSEDDVQMDNVDGTGGRDEILQRLNEPGGQNSPGTDEANERAALLGFSTSQGRSSSPLTDLPSTPARDDIMDPSSEPHSRDSIQNASEDDAESTIESNRGLLGGMHGGVLGRGRDGTGRRGRVRNMYNTSKRTIRR